MGIQLVIDQTNTFFMCWMQMIFEDIQLMNDDWLMNDFLKLCRGCNRFF